MAAPELDVTARLTGAVSQSDESLRAVIKIALLIGCRSKKPSEWKRLPSRGHTYVT